MSLLAVQGGATGTGTVTLLAPVTNTNRTLTLPDATGTVLDSTGGTTQTALTVTNGATIQGLTVGRGAGAVATNTTIGNGALQANTTAGSNTAVGYQAGYTNVTGAGNTFIGHQAGYASAVSGNAYNTCIGVSAGNNLTTGVSNTFIGTSATASSSGALITTGSKNTILGAYSGNQGGLDIRTASNYIVLSDGEGNPRIYHSGTGTYGDFRVPSVYGNTTGSAANCFVFADGSIYRSTSSLKYKRDVQDATHGLAEVLQLRPVTYKGKGENDGEAVFGGLIAEEVHDAGLTEFVQYASDGSPDALAYGNMVSLMVKAIQELKVIVDAQGAEIAALKGAAA